MDTFYSLLHALRYLWVVLLTLASLFLIILVLVQRGRGGGLTGALGGMGGQSAFGAKAGDVFTRITVIVASVWIFLSLVLFYTYSHPPERLREPDEKAVEKGPLPKKSIDD